MVGGRKEVRRGRSEEQTFVEVMWSMEGFVSRLQDKEAPSSDRDLKPSC